MISICFPNIVQLRQSIYNGVITSTYFMYVCTAEKMKDVIKKKLKKHLSQTLSISLRST